MKESKVHEVQVNFLDNKKHYCTWQWTKSKLQLDRDIILGEAGFDTVLEMFHDRWLINKSCPS